MHTRNINVPDPYWKQFRKKWVRWTLREKRKTSQMKLRRRNSTFRKATLVTLLHRNAVAIIGMVRYFFEKSFQTNPYFTSKFKLAEVWAEKHTGFIICNYNVSKNPRSGPQTIIGCTKPAPRIFHRCQKRRKFKPNIG